MRIRIEDVPSGVDIREIIIDLDISANNVENAKPVATVTAKTDIDAPIETREPKPIPDEMNLSF